MLGVLLISCATAFSWFARRAVLASVTLSSSSLTSRSLSSVIASSLTSLLSEISSRTKYDSPLQKWFRPFAFVIPDNLLCLIHITPLDDKIPLRNLFLPDGNTQRRELSEVWHDTLDKLNHRELEMILLDFFDKNNRPRVASKEEKYFLNRSPYDISELLILSSDITPEILYGNDTVMGLSDYCTVYSDGKININVAPLHVLELLPGLNAGGLARTIDEYRRENAIENMSGLLKIPGFSARNSNQLTNIITFKSRYYQVRIDITGEGENVSSYNIILDRTTKNIVRWEEI